MTMNYRADHVLARADAFRPEDMGRLNEILDRAGLGRPLGEPASGQAPLIRIPVHDKTDPLDIEAAMRAAQPAVQDGPAVFADRQSSAGTLLPGTFFTATGKKSGHGMGWVPAPGNELPDAPPWDPAASHPVIAVLDSGVLPHRWLHTDGDPPFLLDADGMDGWHSPVESASPAHQPFPPGTHWGHGTFIAGLIRRAAPHAQVLSLRVMNGKGIVDDSAAVHALTWLRTAAVRPDIVLMAFGRQASADDPTLNDLRRAVRALTEQHVTVVASAGNNGSDQPVYPAAFATELGPKVVSVGAIATRNRRALYSNHGPWVTAGWLGTDIVSINPQTIRHAGDHQIAPSAVDNPVNPVAADSCAWWTGTSFAAAIAAGHLASGQRAGVPLPEAAAQP
jgi:hypothetical protein